MAKWRNMLFGFQFFFAKIDILLFFSYFAISLFRYSSVWFFVTFAK